MGVIRQTEAKILSSPQNLLKTQIPLPILDISLQKSWRSYPVHFAILKK